MTDNDKELEENIKFLAKYCNQEYNDIRVDAVILGASELINRQNTEIKRLKIENQSLRMAANSYKIHYSEARTEAVKEFAERFLKKVHDNHYLLSDRNNSKDYGMFTVGIEQAVNETKEEMVGDTE